MSVEALTTHAPASPSRGPDWREIELTRSILESSREAFVSIDAAGKIISWNQAAEQGREVPIELTITPTRVDGETVFNAFLHDIGERRAAASERALQEAHARFQGAFEAAPIGMALVDLDGGSSPPMRPCAT